MDAYKNHLQQIIDLQEQEIEELKKTIEVYKKYIECEIGGSIRENIERSRTPSGLGTFKRIDIPQASFVIPIGTKPLIGELCGMINVNKEGKYE